MKKLLFLFLGLTLVTLTACSNDDDKADVNYVSAKFNGVEERFTIISVDKVDYDGYTDIIVRATKNGDPTRTVTLASEFGVTGPNIMWGFYFETEDGYYEQDPANFSSNLTSNSNGSYAGTFSGSIVEESNGSVIVVTNGSFNIKY
jgi:hypothetical protein